MSLLFDVANKVAPVDHFCEGFDVLGLISYLLTLFLPPGSHCFMCLGACDLILYCSGLQRQACRSASGAPCGQVRTRCSRSKGGLLEPLCCAGSLLHLHHIQLCAQALHQHSFRNDTACLIGVGFRRCSTCRGP